MNMMSDFGESSFRFFGSGTPRPPGCCANKETANARSETKRFIGWILHRRPPHFNQGATYVGGESQRGSSHWRIVRTTSLRCRTLSEMRYPGIAGSIHHASWQGQDVLGPSFVRGGANPPDGPGKHYGVTQSNSLILPL